jgi:hypothetical protein
MIRHVVVAVAASMLLLPAGPALGDVAPFGGCGGKPRPLPCDAASQSQAGRSCEECASSATACIEARKQEGYSLECTRREVADGGEVQVEVWCKAVAPGARAGADAPWPAVAGLALASLWASVRIGRRRRGDG